MAVVSWAASNARANAGCCSAESECSSTPNAILQMESSVYWLNTVWRSMVPNSGTWASRSSTCSLWATNVDSMCSFSWREENR